MSLIKNTLHAKRRLMGIALLMPLLLGSIPTATANGGTNGLFSRMESYIGPAPKERRLAQHAARQRHLRRD
jgi:hypothetical protein